MYQTSKGGWSPSSSSHRLLVCLVPVNRNVHLSFISEDIESIFNLCGGSLTKNVCTSYYPETPGSSASIAYAVVEFYSGFPAAEAVTALNGTVLQGVGTIQIYRLLDTSEDFLERLQHIYNVHFGGETFKQLASLLQKQQPPSASTPIGSENQIYMARLEFVQLFGNDEFNVTAAVLGEQDRNIHYILDQAENKVSISLKGVPLNHAEVQDRLHMSITSVSLPHYERAVEMAEDLLQAVCIQYVQSCLQRRIKIRADCGFIRHHYVGIQTADGIGENYTYLGRRERPKVWLDEVPPHALIQPPVGGTPSAAAAAAAPVQNKPAAAQLNKSNDPQPPNQQRTPWNGRRSRGRSRGGFHDTSAAAQQSAAPAW